MNYQLYTNLDARFSRPYEQGDRLVKGYSDWLPGDSLDAIYDRHNRDDRPDGQTAPSLSVGDVIVIAETAWSVANLGFARVDLDPADLITDRPYLEVIR